MIARAMRFLGGAIVLSAVGVGIAGAQSLDPGLVTQPEGVSLQGGDPDALLARGAELAVDESLGTSGVACTSCHTDFAQYKETFRQPYPHLVAMAKNMAGMDEVNAAEMVQLCMVVPMATDPLPWDSEELAALVAYVEAEQKAFAAQ